MENTLCEYKTRQLYPGIWDIKILQRLSVGVYNGSGHPGQTTPSWSHQQVTQEESPQRVSGLTLEILWL